MDLVVAQPEGIPFQDDLFPRRLEALGDLLGGWPALVEANVTVVSVSSTAQILEPSPDRLAVSRLFNTSVLSCGIQQVLQTVGAPLPPAAPPLMPRGGILGTDQIASCPAGQELSNDGASCGLCSRGHYCIGGQRLPCPTGSYSEQIGLTGPESCTTCPRPGVACSGASVEVQKGYFMWKKNDSQVFACPLHSACLGSRFVNSSGSNPFVLAFGKDTCAEGHTGVLCGACEPGFYRGKKSCLPCEDVGEDDQIDAALGMAIFVPLMGIAFVFGVALYLRACSLDSQWKSLDRLVSRSRVLRTCRTLSRRLNARMAPLLPIVSGLFKALLSFSQCLSAVGRFEQVRWPDHFVQEFLPVLNALDIELFALVPAECVGKQRLGFPFELAATLLCPFAIILGPYALLWIIQLHTRLLACQTSCCRAVYSAHRGAWRLYTNSRSFKLMELGILLIYPTLARKCLSTFSCVPAMDEEGQSIELLREDPAVVCFEGSWWVLMLMSIGGLVFFCFGLPLFAIQLIRQSLQIESHPKTPVAVKLEAHERVSLLISSYEPKFWYMEPLWLAHKFFFTGVIHLLASKPSLQIYAGTIASLLVFLGTLISMPYKYDICDFVQLAVLLQLLFTYITASHLLEVSTDGTPPMHMGDTMSNGLLDALLIAVNMTAFFVILTFVAMAILHERARRKREEHLAMSRLLVFPDGSVPILPDLADEGLAFHLFLSHAWGTGQDQMRVLKNKLLVVLPEIKCFLDVDDLKEGRGREYVEQSHTVCIFVSKGYFSSCNCMREFLRAVSLGKQIISLVESERNKGALTPSEVLDQLIHAESLYDKWGLTAEFNDWGWTKPSPQDLHKLLCLEHVETPGAQTGISSHDLSYKPTPRSPIHRLSRIRKRMCASGFCASGKRGCRHSSAAQQTRPNQSTADQSEEYTGAIYWERLTDFQNVTIRLICERVLHVAGTVYFGDLDQTRPKLQPPQHRLSYHIYCSAHNARSLDIVTEVAATLDAEVTRRRYVAPPKEKPRHVAIAPKRKVRSGNDIGDVFLDAMGSSLDEVARAANTVVAGVQDVAANVQDAANTLAEESQVGHVKKSRLHVTRNARELAACEHMLLYLHRDTWTSGLTSAALAQEVKQAMDLGVHILLVHEMPGVESERRHGVEFSAFFECEHGSTPETLLSAGIYGQIALALKGGAWRQVSLLQTATALCAEIPYREAPEIEVKPLSRWKGLKGVVARNLTGKRTASACSTSTHTPPPTEPPTMGRTCVESSAVEHEPQNCAGVDQGGMQVGSQPTSSELTNAPQELLVRAMHNVGSDAASAGISVESAAPSMPLPKRVLANPPAFSPPQRNEEHNGQDDIVRLSVDLAAPPIPRSALANPPAFSPPQRNDAHNGQDDMVGLSVDSAAAVPAPTRRRILANPPAFAPPRRDGGHRTQRDGSIEVERSITSEAGAGLPPQSRRHDAFTWVMRRESSIFPDLAHRDGSAADAHAETEH